MVFQHARSKTTVTRSSGKKKPQQNLMITVFYDGKCGLCRKEIHHYRNIAPEGIFLWQDVTDSDYNPVQEGLSVADGLKLLHAKDADGHMHIGVDAFILIWKQLKRWRILAALVRLPIVYPVAHLIYRNFAQRRFQKLKHCQLAARQEKPSAAQRDFEA